MLNHLRFMVFVFALFGAATSFAQEPAKPKTAPELQGLRNGIYTVIKTNYGTMVGQLYYNKTPHTVGNFIYLAEGKIPWPNPTTNQLEKNKPFYNGLTFHRIIPKFMIQGGCPLGNGSSGPGYSIFEEVRPDLKHTGPGIFSMAKTRMPNTTGSQFFITLGAPTWLDGKHTVFGKIVKGLDVLTKIGGVKTGSNDRPEEPVTMVSVTIGRIGEAAKAWDPSTAVNNKDVPQPKGEADPARTPKAQASNNEKIAALKYILVRYKDTKNSGRVLTRSKEEAMEMAHKIVALLRQKGANFDQIGQKYGDYEGHQKVAEIKWDPANNPDSWKAASKLQVGQIFDPLDGPSGLYIFTLPKEFEGSFTLVPEAKGEKDPAKFWNPKGEKSKEQIILHYALIFYRNAQGAPARTILSKEKALENAKRIVALAREKGANFVEVCGQYADESPSGRRVAGIPWQERERTPAIYSGLSAMKPGQVSDPIITPNGVFIFSRPTKLLEAQHILISYQGTPVPGVMRTQVKAKELAEELLKKLTANEILWNEACQQSDDKQSGPEGKLGKFARGMMVPAFDKAVFKLKPGEMCPTIVETQFGYHILKRIR